MKQLQLISAALYCQPWCILPTHHIELGQLYRSYLEGSLPQALEGSGQVSSGIAYEVDDRSGIALISVEGIIAKRAPDMMCGPTIADISRLDTLLRDVAHDSSIKTLVIYFDTPGGMGIGLQETSLNVQDVIDSGTRVVSYTDMLCASAGYWIAAACQEIYAAPSSIIGSIGTYIAAIDDSRAWEMKGQELKLFRDGELKAMGHPGKSWTEEEEKHMEQRVALCGGKFKAHVRSRRSGIEESSMQGQAFAAEDAPAGMVDGFHRDLESLIAAEMQLIFDKGE